MTDRPPPTLLPHTRAWGLGLAFVTACISGVAIFVNAHFVGQTGDATVYTTAKNAVAAGVLLLLLGVGVARRPRPEVRRPLGTHRVLGLAVLGAVGGSVPFVLFFEGLARADEPARAGFIHKTLLVWVAILAVPLLRERLTALHGAAIVLLVAGQAVLVPGLTSLRFGDGELMVLGATLLWAVEFVVAKRLLRSISSLAVGTARLGIGIVILGAYVVASGRAGLLAGLSAQVWMWAAVTGLILAGFVASWYAALSRAQAVDVTAVLVFGQIVTATLTAVVIGAPIQADLLGLGLILGGVAAVTYAVLRPSARSAAVAR